MPFTAPTREFLEIALVKFLLYADILVASFAAWDSPIGRRSAGELRQVEMSCANTIGPRELTLSALSRKVREPSTSDIAHRAPPAKSMRR
jgi:hypothetical protein